MTTIYTIGHSNHPLDRFLGLLDQHAIGTVVDVRSRPYSRWVPHVRKELLARAVAAAGMEYLFLGRELGGRPEGAEFYDAEGHVDHALRARAADFQAGIERLVELAGARPTAIVCAEENPARCHRRLLVTPALQQRALAVVHIRGDGRLEPDQAPDSSSQLSLFQ